MLVEQLSTAFKCHSSIGNSLDLKEMMDEVLKAFVTESYAIYAQFDFKVGYEFKKISSFGKCIGFDSNQYYNHNKTMNLIGEDDRKILKIVLNEGNIYLVTKTLNADCGFFFSMFESLVPKLNISIESCVNYKKLVESHKVLNEQKLQLIEANKVKDEFLANMSHELKTPLNSIFLISTIMSKNKDEKYDEKTVKNMEVIKKSANDLLELINDILDISQIDAGKIKMNFNSLNIKDLILELYDSFEPVTLNKGIAFTKNIVGESFEINSDGKRVKQIIKNLLSNAIKFTQNGSVSLDLIENANSYEISIKDTGIGIEKDKLEHIFDRFKQEDGTTTRKFGGTGLGLTISKELACLLGGQIKVKSEKNIGSTFTFIIPKEGACLEINSDLKEKTPLVPTKKLETTNLVLNHSDSIVQFKLAIKFKKLGFDVNSIINLENIKTAIDGIQKGNIVLVLDESSSNFEEIYDDIKIYKDNLVLITPKVSQCVYAAKCYVDKDFNEDELISQIQDLTQRVSHG